MSSIFYDSPKEMTEILRQSAKKQLDSYADQWIMMFELLQNALDATESNTGTKLVSIDIDPGSNQITVSDNGTGFPTDMGMFALGKGTKGDINDHSIRGEHGVGMKMVILCSELFEVWTRTAAGKTWKATFTDGWRFLESKETEHVTLDAKDSIIPAEYTTTIRVKFPRSPNDKIIRLIDVRQILRNILNPYINSTPPSYFQKQNRCELFVEHYFRTSSYTGDVNRLFDGKPAANLKVVIKKDDALSEKEIEEYYPVFLRDFWQKPRAINFKACYWDPISWYTEPERKGMRTKQQIKSFSPNVLTPGHMWVLKLTKPEEYMLLLDNPHIKEKYPKDYFKELINKRIRGLFIIVCSAASNSKYNINSVMITQPDQVIAADGVVTTNQIRTPKRGKNQNYLNNIHFVVNIADRVNYGKQGVKNPYLLSQLYTFFEEIYVRKLVDLARSVAGKGGGSGPTQPPEYNIIKLDIIDEPEISIKRVPFFENTLIALTHELIAKGVIEGLESYQISSIEKYDCPGIIRVRDQISVSPQRDDDLANIEYKVKIMDLINDLELGNKEAKEIDLAIVWDDDIDSSVTAYHYLDLEQSSWEKIQITGVEKVLRCVATGIDIPVLVVKDMVRTKENR